MRRLLEFLDPFLGGGWNKGIVGFQWLSGLSIGGSDSVCADAAIGRELSGRTVRASSVHWFTLDHLKPHTQLVWRISLALTT